jgi:8-oxo-dGTP diphosphatase
VTETGFTEPEVWFAGLPGVVIAAGAIITDPVGRVLLVKPNYRELWSLPGGICEFGEPPHLGCEREVAEETGLRITAGRLLVVDWSRPYGPQARPLMHFIFDGARVANDARIVIQESELDGYRFAAPGELPEYLPPRGLLRLTSALKARRSGTAIFIPQEFQEPG